MPMPVAAHGRWGIVVAATNFENYHLVSVARAVQVLGSLDTDDGASLSRVARETGLSEATALRYLASLTHGDLVERDEETGVYRLGFGLYRLGMRALAQRDIHRVALPYMRRLRDDFEETVNLAARQRRQIVILEMLDSPRSLRKGVGAGARDTWHSTSVGKAILSRLTAEDVAAILDRERLDKLTPKTITSRTKLAAALDEVRRAGYAVDDEESDEGLRCAGAPILDHRGAASYAISVSGPTSRMTASRLVVVGKAVARAAAQISEELGLVEGAPGHKG
ncbi:MAG TPA: IclR family transcriptional regulator [Mycobacteriales bacterium]|jgi:IclR family acetate operon transcriptional repressor|nr:IclR family transcriptional regulator [Mycobacteriales bacterium]